ncbi:MAG: PorT family protein [Flavobacteriales bacterium]|nr:PorT family protein [Flavobacteriales bacterium]MBT6014138.1 PorT family protein [Flavobacteriales bacterium]
MKRLFILLFITSFSYTLSAQNLSVPKYGVKIGINYSNLNFTQYNYLFGGIVKPTDGYALPTRTYTIESNVGAYIDLKLSANWHLCNTVSFSSIGAITNLDQTWETDTIRTYGNKKETYFMDYITLDPTFEYYVNDRFTLNVGPSVSYLITNNVKRVVTEEGIERTQDSYDGEIKDINDIDAGLNIGTSVYLTDHLYIELNLYIGMIGLENQDDGYNKTLQAISVSLGYTFN